MTLSRRKFLTRSTLSAASAPIMLGLNIDYCEAASDSAIDWSMGFPGDAVLLNRNENPIGALAAARNEANAAGRVGLLKVLFENCRP